MSEQKIIQIGDESRPMTDKEIASHEQAMQEIANAKLEMLQKEQTRRSLFAKLGLTDAEINLLLGA